MSRTAHVAVAAAFAAFAAGCGSTASMNHRPYAQGGPGGAPTATYDSRPANGGAATQPYASSGGRVVASNGNAVPPRSVGRSSAPTQPPTSASPSYPNAYPNAYPSTPRVVAQPSPPRATSGGATSGGSATVPAGRFAWIENLRDAQANARATGRLIFVESGRDACGNCQKLKHKVIPSPEVSSALGALSIGYYDDCERTPNSEPFRLLYANLPDAGVLPLAGWFTPDMRWVHGFWGPRDPSRFLQEVASARAAYMRMASAQQSPHGLDLAQAPTRAVWLRDEPLQRLTIPDEPRRAVAPRAGAASK